MDRKKLFLLKNEMLAANVLANAIGANFITLIMMAVEVSDFREIGRQFLLYDILFTLFAFGTIITATLVYEAPIRKVLDLQFENKTVAEDRLTEAQRRLLNEPFFLMGANMFMWLLAAVIYPVLHWVYGSGVHWVHRSLTLALGNGLITVALAFFFLEHVLQEHLAPRFFPGGGLSRVPQTLRIRIRTRLVVLMMAINVVPLVYIMMTLWRVSDSVSDPSTALTLMNRAVTAHATIFIATGLLLTLLVSRNLTKPFGEILHTLRSVKKGRFEQKIRVTSNDEIGFTGDTINEMTDGLAERERMRHSLLLAREIQQRLLPQETLAVAGVEIRGRSLYCDETGGDYYDYLVYGEKGSEKVAVAVGDVSGHGIPSALLMAAVRSALRQRLTASGPARHIIEDLNRNLAVNVGDSGQFVTLFFLDIDPLRGDLHWVRAGHLPAFVYDPELRMVSELMGPGIALGVSEEALYPENEALTVRNGTVILLTTDGVWEVEDRKGRMFGKDGVLEVLRKHGHCNASELLDALFSAVHRHAGGRKEDDDITAVVVRIG